MNTVILLAFCVRLPDGELLMILKVDEGASVGVYLQTGGVEGSSFVVEVL